MWSEAFVNELTGGDRLSARHPAGRPFEFDPTHKLEIHGNSVPDLRGVASGLKRRLKILTFNRPPLVPDPKLKDTLRAEWPGVLRWMIDGCLVWQETGLSPPPDVETAVKDYFESQDVLGRWVDECCVKNPTFKTKFNLLRISFNQWAERNGERIMGTTAFHDAIKNYPDSTVAQVTLHGTRTVNGLALKEVSECDVGDVG